MIKRILELLYPAKCPFCKKILQKQQQGICGSCRETLPYIEEPRCMKCGKPIRKMEDEFCFDCKNKSYSFEEGRSLWIHKAPVNHAIYAFKYHSLRCYGTVFGKEIGKTFLIYLESKQVEALVPIPLHRSKYKSRGYNQAEVLAHGIEEVTGIPVRDVLKRVKMTPPQKQLNDKERRRNIKNAFVLKEEMHEKTVALIDDIYTTGSTLNEAASILKQAGVSKVYFLTISIGQGF